MRYQGPVLLCFMIVFARGISLYSQIPEHPYPNSRFMTVDSVRMHYRTWNDTLSRPKGKIVLVHGFCGSTFCWRNNYDTLAAAGYRVVSVDLPGFGYSQRSASINQSQSNRGKLIWALIENTDGSDTTKWNIVGHSMGGGTAEAMALMKPGRTKSLTIVDGMVFIKNENVNVAIVGLTNHPLYREMLLSYTEHSYLSFNHFRSQLKGTYGFLPDTATVNGYLKPLLIEGTSETVVNILSNSSEIQSLNAHGLSSLPVLVIWGRKDKTIRLSNGKKLKRAVPSIELKVIPEARHMPMETHPEIFNAMLVAFLNKNNK
jgi:pimeloyl-ACP methyl ester carboxylesterase